MLTEYLTLKRRDRDFESVTQASPTPGSPGRRPLAAQAAHGESRSRSCQCFKLLTRTGSIVIQPAGSRCLRLGASGSFKLAGGPGSALRLMNLNQ